MTVVSYQECEIRNMLAENCQMRTYFKEHDALPSLSPRDAFSGGQCSVFKRYCEFKDDGDYDCYFADICSL